MESSKCIVGTRRCKSIPTPFPPGQVMESWKFIFGSGRVKIKLEDIRICADDRCGAEVLGVPVFLQPWNPIFCSLALHE